MNHSLKRLKELIPGFNEKVITEAVFWRIMRRERIHFDFWRLAEGANGFYGVNSKYKRKYRYMVVDERLRHTTWLETAFHELIHHFLHVPKSRLVVFFSKADVDDRREREAERFALMMKIPRPLFLELCNTQPEDLQMFTISELQRRKEIYDTWGE